jgi:hypothetical protein
MKATPREVATRRSVLGLVCGAMAALGLVATDARKGKRRGKRKRKASRPNACGCLIVGQRCRGNDGLCCSGICSGSKPKKGGKDTSRCVAHNTGGCLAAEQSCGATVPDTPCGAGGICLSTTGNAAFCGRIEQGGCAACRRDVDCQGAFGAGAACVVCRNSSPELCPATGNRACIVPAA